MRAPHSSGRDNPAKLTHYLMEPTWIDALDGDDVEVLYLLEECDLVRWREAPEMRTACHCTKTHCLKLYCVCYAAGDACGPRCRCQGCNNTVATVPRKTATFCTCTRSGCQKRYCVCYAAGRPCGPCCTCTGCKNCA